MNLDIFDLGVAFDEPALCFGEPPEWWFPDAQQTTLKRARAICAMCPAREQCLREAMEIENGLAKQYRFGIYGGLTANQRAKLDDDSTPKCKRGHRMDAANTRMERSGTTMRCRACDRDRKAVARINRKEAA